jgi:hypothetical protein
LEGVGAKGSSADGVGVDEVSADGITEGAGDNGSKDPDAIGPYAVCSEGEGDEVDGCRRHEYRCR